jgi:hypothetical protein
MQKQNDYEEPDVFDMLEEDYSGALEDVSSSRDVLFGNRLIAKHEKNIPSEGYREYPDVMDVFFDSDQMYVYNKWKTAKAVDDAYRRARQEAIEEHRYMENKHSVAEELGVIPRKSEIYSVKKLFRKRDRLMEALKGEDDKHLVRIIGSGSSPDEYIAAEEVIGEKYTTAVPVLSALFSSMLGVPVAPVEQTLYAHMSRENDGYVTRQACRRMAWICAANVVSLRLGTAVPPYKGPAEGEREWTPIQIMDARQSFKGTRPGWVYVHRALGGKAATTEFTKFFPSEYSMSRLKVNMFGLAKFATTSPVTFVGMRFWGVLGMRNDELDYDYYYSTSSFSAHNSKLYNARKKPCPIDLQIDCEECPVGRDQCSRAAHRETYRVGKCTTCGDPNGYFYASDPTDAKSCITCRVNWKRRQIKRSVHSEMEKAHAK